MQREGSPACRDGAADHRDTDAVKRALYLLVTIATHLVVEICGHKEQTRSNQRRESAFVGPFWGRAGLRCATTHGRYLRAHTSNTLD